jgi:hypothetical protein
MSRWRNRLLYRLKEQMGGKDSFTGTGRQEDGINYTGITELPNVGKWNRLIQICRIDFLL